MRKILVVVVLGVVLSAGCESLRFTPSESQKQNAWLHNRTAMLAAETASAQNCSEQLQSLSRLSELQSRSFCSYYGLPREFPPADTAEEILSQSSFGLARGALAESSDRPDMLELADSAFEMAIGIAALLGGIYGTKTVRFLKQARAKSQALQEIVAGNELFKKAHSEYACAFKKAQDSQSVQTRQIVTELKST